MPEDDVNAGTFAQGSGDAPGAPRGRSVRIRTFVDMWLGEQLRMRRKSLGKSLREVSDAAGISVSVWIETFLANLSLDGSADDSQGAVVRAGNHRAVDATGHSGIHKEVLTPPIAADGNLQMYRAAIEPGGSTGGTFFTTFRGHQIGYVIEGVLELHVGKRLFSLRAGDSFWYDNAMPRRWHNPGPVRTVVLWAVSLPTPAGAPPSA